MVSYIWLAFSRLFIYVSYLPSWRIATSQTHNFDVFFPYSEGLIVIRRDQKWLKTLLHTCTIASR